MNEEVKKEEERKDIEVELKYQPISEKLDEIKKNAERLPDEENRDIYFDFSGFKLLKNKIRLRYRLIKRIEDKEKGEDPFEANGSFELKVNLDSGISREIKGNKNIIDYLENIIIYLGAERDYLEKEMRKIEECFKEESNKIINFLKNERMDLEEAVVEAQNIFVVIADFKTKREKYKKDEFNIDIDNVNYGEKFGEYDLCEIEIMTNKTYKDVAKGKIKEFAKNLVPMEYGKLKEFLFRSLSKDEFEKLYPPKDNELNKEKKKALNNETKMR